MARAVVRLEAHELNEAIRNWLTAKGYVVEPDARARFKEDRVGGFWSMSATMPVGPGDVDGCETLPPM